MEDCKRSGSSRTVAELCLIRLCDPPWTPLLPGWPPGLPGWRPLWPREFPSGPRSSGRPSPGGGRPRRLRTTQTNRFRQLRNRPRGGGTGCGTGVPGCFRSGSRVGLAQTGGRPAGQRGMPAYTFLKNPDTVTGVRQGGVLTVYFQDDFAYDQVNKPNIVQAIAGWPAPRRACRSGWSSTGAVLARRRRRPLPPQADGQHERSEGFYVEASAVTETNEKGD